MDKRRGLAVLVTFTLGLLGPVWLSAGSAGADDPGTANVNRVDSPQRGEDPLQAPRGDTR